MTVVLAGSYAETAKFARKKGLSNIRHIVDRAALAEMSPFVASVIHVLPSFYARPDRHGILEELNATRRQFVGLTRIEYTDDEVREILGKPKRNFALDTSPDAVPGQISVEEAIADVQESQLVTETPVEEVIAEVQASQLEALKAIDPTGEILANSIAAAPESPEPITALGREEYLAKLEADGVLEPEGFELSDDPDVQARQILESAAHFAEPESTDNLSDVGPDAEPVKFVPAEPEPEVDPFFAMLDGS